MIDDLEKILKKDPIITTKHAKDICQNPEGVYQYYSMHAYTHMPLGDTEAYYTNIQKWIVINKGAFIGGVVGDYGLGKTSLLIYFWHRAHLDNIISVPPYSWNTLQDNFDAVYHWSRFRLATVSEKLVMRLDDLYDNYKTRTIADEAEKMSKDAGIPFEKARSIIEKQVNEKKLSLDYKEEDLIDFYEGISEIALEGNFQGLLIFQDELQQTVDSGNMSFKTMASILFGLANGIGAREGSYGLFLGMPLTFQARMSKERRDVLDRLRKQKGFIDLGEMYTHDFPKNLWERYVETFELNTIADHIIDNETIISIGQICDSRRRDLGNGPRSVISTFNMMIGHYKIHDAPYLPMDFVNSCLDGEITLGDKSTYVIRMNDILSKPFIKGRYDDVILFLGAYPQGTTRLIEDKYKMTDILSELIKETGGYGKIITTAPGSGHILKDLRSEKIEEEETELRGIISHFYSEYSPDRTHMSRATNAFINEIFPVLFPPQNTKNNIIGWGKESSQWRDLEWGLRQDICGTYESSIEYPMRRVRLEFVLFTREPAPKPEIHPDDLQYMRNKDPLDLLFRFDVNWDSHSITNKGKIYIEKWPGRIGTFELNLFYSEETDAKLPDIHDSIPVESCSPFLYLSLIDYMDELDLGSDAQQIWTYLKNELITTIINTLFNSDLMETNISDIELYNKGKFIIQDLFHQMCEALYPNYQTIIKSNSWERRMNEYQKLLTNTEISISAKRGHELIKYDKPSGEFEKNYSRKEIAQLFNKGSSNMDNWLAEYGPLVDLSDISKGELKLGLHPIEQYILQMIEDSHKTRLYNNKECKFIEGKLILNEVCITGYRLREAEIIINEIGPARKIFSIDNSTGFLYKVPQTLEEYQTTIDQMVSDLKADREVLEKEVKDFEPLPMRETYKEAMKIKDEEHYIKIRDELRNERIRINTFVSSQLSKFIEDYKNSLDIIEKELERNEGTYKRILSADFESSAQWIQAIKGVQNDEKRKYSLILKELTTSFRVYKTVKEKEKKYYSMKGNKDVSLFIDYYKELKVQKSTINDEFKPTIKLLAIAVSNLDKWFDIGRLYNNTFHKALVIKQSLGNEDIMNKYEQYEADLRIYIQENKEESLKVYEREHSIIERLMGEADGIIRNFRGVFNDQKAYIIELLKLITSPPPPLRTTFSEEDIKGVYESLSNECVDLFNNELSEISSDYYDILVDVEYSIKILGLADIITESDIEEIINKNNKEIERIQSEIDVDLFKDSENRERISEVTNEIKQCKDSLIFIRSSLRKILEPAPASKDASELISLVTEGPPKNLKDIILELKDKKKMDLDEILNLLKECFKNRQIDIIVKRKM